MKLVLLSILLAVSCGCDAERRVARIIEKHPEIIESKIDTIRVPTQFIDSVQVVEGDTVFTWYYVRDTIYETYVQRNTIDPSNVETRQEKRLESRENRVGLRQGGRGERVELRQEGKKERVQVRKDSKVERVQVRNDARSSRGMNWAIWIAVILIIIIIVYAIVKRFLR